jgi:phenylpyruvate tautomerase PptA (4-oxalocrotonate tautomerase family)
MEMVLIEEMDMQRWFTVAYSTAFGRELFLSLN